jgi:hypothetical protein
VPHQKSPPLKLARFFSNSREKNLTRSKLPKRRTELDKVYHGDCLDFFKTIPDESVDFGHNRPHLQYRKGIFAHKTGRQDFVNQRGMGTRLSKVLLRFAGNGGFKRVFSGLKERRLDAYVHG